MRRHPGSLADLWGIDCTALGSAGQPSAPEVRPWSPLQPFLNDRRLSIELRALLAAWSNRDLPEASSDARVLWDFLERKRPLVGLVLSDERTSPALSEALRAWLERTPDHAIRDAQLLAQILGACVHARPSTAVAGGAGHDPDK